MRFALITDAWLPQVNGVVRTLTSLCRMLRQLGHEVLVIEPGLFSTIPCPRYPAIRLALMPRSRTVQLLEDFAPDAVHIATEGPVGMAGRSHCLKRGWPFTTSYHTQFPKYLHLYFRIPEGPSYRFLRWFHRPAVHTLVPTASVLTELSREGFEHLAIWGRGVDLELFRPRGEAVLDLPRPVFLNTGRVCVEKNLEAFAELSLPGTKVIVGDGPQLQKLRRRFDDVVFTGYLPDREMSRYYAAADVFVFPSRTDTFGNVMLESMASATPVAAYPVTGPVDVVQDGITGVLDTDLRQAAMAALEIDRCQCRRYAEAHPWTRLARQFTGFLQPINGKLTELEIG